MNNIDKIIYIKRYNNRLKEHGYDIKTLGWGGDKDRQILRFKIALELSNFLKEKEISSILDVGCGFGDMGGQYLEKFFPEIKYTGVDINQKLIDEGKKKYPKLDLRCLDILDEALECKYDLVCECGIFNFRLKSENQLLYIESMIRKMYAISNYGVCVDFMSTFVDYKHDNAFHMNEFKALKICKKLSKRVILRNDYLEYEYCMYIIKDMKND